MRQWIIWLAIVASAAIIVRATGSNFVLWGFAGWAASDIAEMIERRIKRKR